MRNFFENLQEKFLVFMQGRNGVDSLGKWSLYAGLILALLNIFVGNIILSTLSFFALFYSIFRMYSRNIASRRSENDKFEGFLDRIKSRFGGKRTSKDAGQSSEGNAHSIDRVSTIYFRCSNCGQSLSVPRGKGSLRVTCPKCQCKTNVRS